MPSLIYLSRRSFALSLFRSFALFPFRCSLFEIGVLLFEKENYRIELSLHLLDLIRILLQMQQDFVKVIRV